MGFEGPVGGYQLSAEGRERGAAAAPATDTHLRHRLLKRGVEILEQQPRPPVAHLQLARRLGQRAAARNVLQQGDLPRTHRTLRTEINSEAHGYFRHKETCRYINERAQRTGTTGWITLHRFAIWSDTLQQGVG